MLPARMRNGLGWNDACILNISLHGLMIYSKCSVEPGSHVELCRGGRMISTRVVWRKNQRIGLCSPEPLPVDELISSDAAKAAFPTIAGRAQIERRNRPRDGERSRDRSRAIEFVSLVLVGTAFAGGVAAYAQQALTKPLSAVQTALGSR